MTYPVAASVFHVIEGGADVQIRAHEVRESRPA